jgi:hypothetical protein
MDNDLGDDYADYNTSQGRGICTEKKGQTLAFMM